MLFVFTVFAVGCKQEDGCTKFGSDNYNPDAVIDDGSCIPARDKFLGDFRVTSDCFDNPYTISISEEIDEREVIISTLSDTLSDIKGIVVLQDITIERQTVGIGISIEGAGTSISQDTIELSYRIIDVRNGNEQTYDCFEELVRQ